MKIAPLPDLFQSFQLLTINLLSIFHPTIDYIDGAHWFIKTLVESYVLFSFSLLIKDSSYREIFLVITVLLCFIIKFNLEVLPIIVQGEARQFIDGYIAIMLGYFTKRLEKAIWKDIISIIFVSLISIYFVNISLDYIFLLLIIAVFFFWGKKLIMNNIFGNKLFVLIGTYSYSWYLIHQMIGFSIMNYLLPKHNVHMLWVLIPMSLTFVMAILIQRVVNLMPPKIIA